MLSAKGGLLVAFLSLLGVTVLVNCQGLKNMESQAHIVGGWRERSPDDNEIQVTLVRILVSFAFMKMLVVVF